MAQKVIHRLVAWWENDVHTTPFNCSEQNGDNCGFATYKYVLCVCGERFPIDQFGNYSSNLAHEYTGEELFAVEEHVVGCKVEEIEFSELAYMRGRGHVLHESVEDTVDWQ